MVIAVVVRIGAAGLLGVAGKGLPRLLADRNGVLRPCILLGRLRLQRLGWLNGLFRLRLRVDCLNRVN